MKKMNIFLMTDYGQYMKVFPCLNIQKSGRQ